MINFNIAFDGLSGKNREYVVVGRDATTTNARVKLILEADFETQVYRRAKQLNAKEFEAIGKVFSDLLKRDVDSFDLVLEAKKVATIINTSDLSIEQVVARILSCILWNLTSTFGTVRIFFAQPIPSFLTKNKMSKRTSSEQIKQVNLSDLQEESSTLQIKEYTVQELIVLKNWELANYIADKAYTQLIAKLEERHEFMKYLKEFYELQVTDYEKIEREVLPKNHSDDKKLFKDAQEWRKNVLMKSKNATKFQASHLATKILDLEFEIDQQEQEQEKQKQEKKTRARTRAGTKN
ncbi:hypothetical protein F8M41_003549 [Gigaspora margarita]|uniref:(d)CMP kinase n=1 Tax=Gigaspora margarita TaxID=4874 RepID=A0A8H4AY18_GIGMA|nr:hypothetical protein F8M41_003549 [Gigaspora margarita]